MGVEVFSKTYKMVTSENSLQINLTNMPEGIYYLKIKGESGSFVKKILIHQ